MGGVDFEEAALDQRLELRLAQRLDGIAAGDARAQRAVDALAEPQPHHHCLLHPIAAADVGHLLRAVALALDRGQPAFGPADAPRRPLGLPLREPAMRARPDADVILVPPVDQIMAAGRTGAR